MISELDLVILMQALPGFLLEKGDVGTVVHVLDPGKAFEVEFVTYQGKTVALVTLTSDQIRPLAEGAVPAANHSLALAA
jgi:hypothetical protein